MFKLIIASTLILLSIASPTMADYNVDVSISSPEFCSLQHRRAATILGYVNMVRLDAMYGDDQWITYQVADDFEHQLRKLGFELDNYFANINYRPKGRECGEYVNDMMLKLDGIWKSILELR